MKANKRSATLLPWDEKTNDKFPPKGYRVGTPHPFPPAQTDKRHGTAQVAIVVSRLKLATFSSYSASVSVKAAFSSSYSAKRAS